MIYIVYDNSNIDNYNYFMRHGYQTRHDIVYIFIARHAYCFDNWIDAMREHSLPDVLTDRDVVVFISSVARGPYCIDWLDKLTALITPTVKLAGVSINCHYQQDVKTKYFAKYNWDYEHFPHVQSLVMVTDKTGLTIGFNNNIFTIDPNESLVDKIYRQEVGFSLAVLTAGYRINCRLSLYRDRDYHLPENVELNCGPFNHGDPFCSYFGSMLNVYEAGFIRTDCQFYPEVAYMYEPDGLVSSNQYCVYIAPNQYDVNVFIDVARSLMNAIRKRGYHCIFANYVMNGYRHIFLGAHKIHFPLPRDSIVFNLEQLFDGSPWVHDSYMNILRSSVVWDYSMSNIKWLTSKGIDNVVHVPIGNPGVVNVMKMERDIDVLFYGCLNERRRNVQKSLTQALPDKNIVFEESAWGVMRDVLIARAKVVLNIHYYPTKIFEIVRMSYLMASGAFIVSEESVSTYPELEAGYVTCEYIDMVDTVKRYLHEPEARQMIAARGNELIKYREQTVPI